MVPSLGSSMKFKQRRIVLFPDPLAPMIAMRSPRFTSRSTPLTTCRSPKRLCRLRMRMTVSLIEFRPISIARREAAFKTGRKVAAGIDQHEVHQRNDRQDLERPIVGRAQKTPLVHDLVHRKQRGEP